MNSSSNLFIKLKQKQLDHAKLAKQAKHHQSDRTSQQPQTQAQASLPSIVKKKMITKRRGNDTERSIQLDVIDDKKMKVYVHRRIVAKSSDSARSNNVLCLPRDEPSFTSRRGGDTSINSVTKPHEASVSGHLPRLIEERSVNRIRLRGLMHNDTVINSNQNFLSNLHHKYLLPLHPPLRVIQENSSQEFITLELDQAGEKRLDEIAKRLSLASAEGISKDRLSAWSRVLYNGMRYICYAHDDVDVYPSDVQLLFAPSRRILSHARR